MSYILCTCGCQAMPKGEREKLLGQRWRALPEAKRARYKAAGQARPTPRHPPSPYTGAHRSHHPRPASEPPSTSPQPPLKRSPTSPLPIPPTLALTTRRPGCPARARVIVPALRPPPPTQPATAAAPPPPPPAATAGVDLETDLDARSHLDADLEAELARRLPAELRPRFARALQAARARQSAPPSAAGVRALAAALAYTHALASGQPWGSQQARLACPLGRIRVSG